ncbi:MAG: hypothetical protein REI12_14610 [Pedobacter sp.]|nr:hypothetical protein [Pedobacter sp.]
MSDLSPKAQEAARAGRLIDAIKIVRAETGMDLKDSKDAVEAFLKTHPPVKTVSSAVQRGDSRQTLKTLIILVLLVTAAVALLFKFELL